MKPFPWLIAFAVVASSAEALTNREIEAKIAHAKALRAKLLPNEKPPTDEVDAASIKKIKTIVYHVPALPQPDVKIVENEDLNEIDEAAPEVVTITPEALPVAVAAPPETEWKTYITPTAFGGLLGLAIVLVPWREIFHASTHSKLRLPKPNHRSSLRLRGRLGSLFHHLWPRQLLSRAATNLRRNPLQPIGDDRREPRLEARLQSASHGYNEWPFGTGNNKRLGAASEAPWAHHRPVVRRGA